MILEETFLSPHCAIAHSGPGSSYRGFTITLRHTTLDRTTLDGWSARCSTWQRTTLETDIVALGGIRTHNPCRRADVDLRIRPRGHYRHFQAVIPWQLRQEVRLKSLQICTRLRDVKPTSLLAEVFENTKLIFIWFMKEREGYDSSMDFSSRLIFQNDHERHSVVTVNERDIEIERCFGLFLSRARSVPPSLQPASRTRPASGLGHTSGRRLFRYVTTPPPSWPEPPACVCVIYHAYCSVQCLLCLIQKSVSVDRRNNCRRKYTQC